MFHDRRKHPRYTVLLRVVAVSAVERFDSVCTNLGPAGGFFTGRTMPTIGDRITFELRAGGLNTPLVELAAQVVRIQPVGPSQAGGFAVTWLAAECALGGDPILRVVHEILRLPAITSHELESRDRRFVLDLQAWHAGTRANPTERAVDRTSSSPAIGHSASGSMPRAKAIHNNGLGSSSASGAVPRMQPANTADEAPVRRGLGQHALTMKETGRFSAPPSRSTGPGRPDAGDGGTLRSSPTGSEVDGSRRSSSSVPVAAPARQGSQPSAAAAASTQPEPGKTRASVPRFQPVVHDSDVFGFDAPEQDKTPEQLASPVVDPGQPSIDIALPRDLDADSWPVWAQGERRPATPGVPSAPVTTRGPQVLVAGRSPVATPAGLADRVDTSIPTVRDPLANRPPTSQTALRDVEDVTPLPGTGAANWTRPSSDAGPRSTGAAHRPRTPGAVRTPIACALEVAYVLDGKWCTAQCMAISSLALAIEGSQVPEPSPSPLTVKVPITLHNLTYALLIRGRVNQVAQPTDGGMLFVLRVDSVDEGIHPGLFARFLESLG